MSLKYVTRFSVSGPGSFPIDMLRYDGCHPRSEQDSGKIAATFDYTSRERVPLACIELAVYHELRAPRITEGRWKSFLWRVNSGSIVTEKLP